MRTRLVIGLIAFGSLLWMLGASEATLSGPNCYGPTSTSAKVQEYRLYFEATADGHYDVTRRAFVRTPTALGPVALSYPAGGWGYTITGGAIYVGVRAMWINTTAPGSAVLPFDSLLFLNGSASTVVEQIGTVRTTYTLRAVTCGSLD